MFDLGVDVSHHLLEQNIDSGAPFVPPGGYPAEVFATGVAFINVGDLDGFNGPGIARVGAVLGRALATKCSR